MNAGEQFFTVDEAAERLNTKPRFVRRLIEERRIVFCRFGRHVRIPASELDAYVRASLVPKITLDGYDHGRAA
ncbi:helix-turn-helix domain-containing protein [Bailinhaonella thermotolerans]|uniref:Helix-turn-helix domain-containing protein n=1 Tax=Bailinhaonella thermotolerans TaxID=1070861 RepID=A0A3A4BIB5_9ACTN|nr:helix-turn-helix domain-containing protein [Bailinhaonella thermotolerans]RJL34572.1 helix-turn-helix domain-containing protein [Bailinhaonella thermotolerans]